MVRRKFPSDRKNVFHMFRGIVKCWRCGKQCDKHVIIENATGTERAKVCIPCLHIILNTPHVHVIESNIGNYC